MISFYIDLKTQNVRMSLKDTPFFHNILKVCRKFFFKFDPDTKTFIIPPIKFGVFYDAISDLDEVEGYDVVSATIQSNLVPKSQIKFNRRVFDTALMRSPPIKGKPPYEDFQLIDAQRMYNRNRYGLFLAMGLGKTWITILALNHIWKDEGMLKTIIITTGSGVYTFYKELEKFAVGLDMSRVAIGDKNNREPFTSEVDILICSYRSFLLISDHYYKKKSNQSFVGKNYRKPPIPLDKWIGDKEAVIILDESHSISNIKARQSKVIHLHSKYFNYRYLLSGTPADKPEKWYSQLKFIDPALVKGQDYWTWVQEVAEVGNSYSQYAIQSFKADKLQELNTSIMSISSRRFVNECLELPEHFVKKVYVPMTGLHKEIYEGFIEYYTTTMMDSGEGGIKTRDALMQFQHLILAVDNPEMLKEHYILDEDLEEKINKFSFKKDHVKIDTLLDLLEEHKDEQVVIWTSHPSVSNELEEALLAKKISVGKVHGQCIPKGMSTDKFKQDVVERFKKNEFRVLLAASQMLTTSITMTNACIQIFFDRTFDYVEFAQVRCRIYRIGQTRPVYSYIIISDRTLDVIRDRNLEDKNFFDKEFLSEQYLSKELARRIFAPLA